MIACLDMYNWPESAAVFDMFWEKVHAGLAERGFDAPPSLSQKGEDLRSAADDASLLLGQVCGITYARDNDERPRFMPLGAFIVNDADLPAGSYSSVLITRKDAAIDLDNPQSFSVAVNGYGSLSGWTVLAQYFSGQSATSPFADVVISGGHRNSAHMVATGQADLAALDVISWIMLERFEPALTAGLNRVGITPPRPGLPLVTSMHHDQELLAALNAAITEAMDTAEVKAAMASIGILGLHQNDPDTYLDLLKL